MKTMPQSLWMRWLLHSVALITAFAAGYWLREGPQPAAAAATPLVPNSARGEKKVAGYISPSPTSPIATHTQPQQSQRPLSGMAQRHISIAQEVASLDAKQTLAALKAGALKPEGEDPLKRSLLIAHYAELDPETALSYVDSLSGAEHEQQRTVALGAWASREPSAAAAHLQQALSEGLATAGDAAAVSAIAREWSRTDPESAWHWAAQLPEESRAEALNQLSARWAKKDAPAALAAAQALPSEADRQAVMQPLVAQLAQSQPAATAQWLRSLPTQQQPSAAAGLMQSWLQKDTAAATQWAQQLPSGAVRDAAISSLVKSPSLRRDPATAAQWAATITDAKLRAELVNLSFSRWQLHDAAAAERWASSLR